MATSSKKARTEAIARAKARLDAREGPGSDLWQVILQYAAGAPDLQTADRATALVLGSILEQGLELSILSHCVFGWNTSEAEAEQKKLFGGGEDAPMNFSVKIRIAYGLGVFGPSTRDDLDTIRHIRNLFAHDKHHLTFDNTEVSGLCDQLKWIEKFPWGGMVGEKPKLPRSRYIETIMHLYSFLAVGIGKPIRYSDGPFAELYA